MQKIKNVTYLSSCRNKPINVGSEGFGNHLFRPRRVFLRYKILRRQWPKGTHNHVLSNRFSSNNNCKQQKWTKKPKTNYFAHNSLKHWNHQRYLNPLVAQFFCVWLFSSFFLSVCNKNLLFNCCRFSNICSPFWCVLLELRHLMRNLGDCFSKQDKRVLHYMQMEHSILVYFYENEASVISSKQTDRYIIRIYPRRGFFSAFSRNAAWAEIQRALLFNNEFLGSYLNIKRRVLEGYFFVSGKREIERVCFTLFLNARTSCWLLMGRRRARRAKWKRIERASPVGGGGRRSWWAHNDVANKFASQRACRNNTPEQPSWL